MIFEYVFSCNLRLAKHVHEKYIASPTQRAVFTRFFVEKSFLYGKCNYYAKQHLNSHHKGYFCTNDLVARKPVIW